MDLPSADMEQRRIYCAIALHKKGAKAKNVLPAFSPGRLLGCPYAEIPLAFFFSFSFQAELTVWP